MDLHRDFRDLLEAFVRFGVRFAIIGGFAVVSAAGAILTRI